MKKCFVLGVVYFLAYLMGCSNVNGLSKQKGNSYFYNVDHVMLNAIAEYYDLETGVENNVEMEMCMVKKYEQGKLYKLVMKSVPLEDARKNIFFYVTDEKIYRIWAYIYQEGKIIEFYDEEKVLTKYFDTDQKLIDNGEVVCQSEEMLMEDVEGKKISISLADNKVTYSRLDIQENGENGFYEWFIWEQGNGLMEYGSGFGAERDILYLTDIEAQ